MEFLTKLKHFIWSKHFLKHLGLVILAYIIIVGGTVLILDSVTNHGQKIEVPSLVGKNVRNVPAVIEELGLQYEILDSIYAPNKPEGTILSQDPRPTDSTDVFVKEGRIIRLRVSKRSRLVEMPSLIDKSQRFAESVLKNRGLKYSIVFETTREADGAVLNQKYKGAPIKEGTRIPIGSTIQLVVGKNQAGEPVQIPDFACLTINEVKARLAELSSITLFESYSGCENAEDSLNAKVVSQTPEFIDGVLSPAGSTITILLQKNGCSD
jgi:beta-lactam-binding protein with PASTA domain